MSAPAATGRLVRVRVWDVPVRLIHWLLVLMLVVLSVTGYLIGAPALALPPDTQWVTWVKIIHRFAAYGFIALLLARIGWMFAARTRWSRWTEWIPTTRARIRQIMPSVRFYAFLEREAPPVVGHNPLAGMAYTVLYLMFVVEILTGLVLWGVEGLGWAAWLTGWLSALLALSVIRFIHHLIMWLTWAFLIHHVYSGILVDRVERSGVMTSIFSGYKFLPEDRT